jgi:hypothetical protein
VNVGLAGATFGAGLLITGVGLVLAVTGGPTSAIDLGSLLCLPDACEDTFLFLVELCFFFNKSQALAYVVLERL